VLINIWSWSREETEQNAKWVVSWSGDAEKEKGWKELEEIARSLSGVSLACLAPFSF
jgi:hypothetical protein